VIFKTRSNAAKILTLGIQSNTDAEGVTVRPECPVGKRSDFYDDGRPSGKGLSFCDSTKK
jgi:hypothetical protein